VDCGRVRTPGTTRYRPKRGQRRDARRADAPAESHGATPRTSRILGGCVHQVNTCVEGQGSVYRSGGIVQGVNAGNGGCRKHTRDGLRRTRAARRVGFPERGRALGLTCLRMQQPFDLVQLSEFPRKSRA
jgi:hypothetical protein